MSADAGPTDDLEAKLAALGGALDHPEGRDLIAKVAAGLAGPDEVTVVRGAHRTRRLVAAVAVAAVVLATVAIPSTRTAIAGLFRSGGVEVRNADEFRPPKSEPTTTTTTTTTTSVTGGGSVGAAQRAVQFPVRVPRLVPDRTPTVTVDPSVPGGLVALDYGDFRVVEVAAGTGPPVIAKGLEPKTRIQAITIGDAPGLWITGTHHFVAYLDRDGNVRQDTVREAGHVLLWASGGVTYRVEGFHQLAGARQIADSIP